MERRRPRPILWSQAQYFVSPFVTEEGYLRFYCLLCDSTIFSTRILITHIRGKYHKSLLDYHGRYITPLEDDLYSCKVCNCVIPRYYNVHTHLNARGHTFQMQRFEEKRVYNRTLDLITAKANEFYNRLQEIMKEGNAMNFAKTNAISVNENYYRLEEKKEEKGATNNVKTEANESNNDCSLLEEKRIEKAAVDNVKVKANESNNDCNRVEEKGEERVVINNFKAKVNESNNDCNRWEEKREGKGATNNVKAQANQSNNSYNRLYEKPEEKSATVCEKAITDKNNEYNRLEEIKEEKGTENHEESNANDINKDHKINCSPLLQESSFFCSPASKFDVVPIKPEVNEFSQYYGTDSSDKKILEEMVCNNSNNDTNSTQDSGIEENTLTFPSSSSEKIAEPQNAENAFTKSYNQTFVDLLDFQSDMYDLRDRLKETRLAMDLCLQTETGQIYCLVCHQIVANTCDILTEHLCSPDLCEYRENILQNGGNFYEFAGEYSQFNLAWQYMECFSPEVINCLVCKSQVRNIDRAIQNHALANTHREKLEEMRTKMRKIFEKMSSRWMFDWYKVQKYSCTPCSEKFESEFEFAKHLNTEEHTDVLKKAKDFGRPFVYDFCPICAIFWCGYRNTYASHCGSRLHNWFERNGEFLASKLPESAQQFLAEWGTQNDDAIDRVNAVREKEEINKIKLMESLGNIKSVFPWTQGCAFGSRITSQCVIDVFLGCAVLHAISAEKMNNGRAFTEDDILYYMMSVNNWMSGKPEIWNLRPLETGGRSPIIHAIHKPTGLACDISFDNGLMIGGLKFVDAFDVIFPSSCKLMNYLSQWLSHCKLTGSQQISSYMLYWLLVFYLQKKSELPSVAALTQIIDGLQVGGSNNFHDKNVTSNLRLKKLLIEFFNFYANFDFHHNVACPLVGESVQKRSFAYPENLPIEMGFYVAHVMYSNNPEEFPIDSPMCIQDPFSLNHNLSKNVSKGCLTNFRTYCAKTAYFLSSS